MRYNKAALPKDEQARLRGNAACANLVKGSQTQTLATNEVFERFNDIIEKKFDVLGLSLLIFGHTGQFDKDLALLGVDP